ncbi:unnamed protein product [Colias eurytheme]|nr:unnamed protein product [Colias eurytheme]
MLAMVVHPIRPDDDPIDRGEGRHAGVPSLLTAHPPHADAGRPLADKVETFVDYHGIAAAGYDDLET